MNLSKIKILILIIVCFSCNKTINNKNPNIVLIVADDLGWTDLSFMGSNYYQTPNIDRLAKRGITFYNAYASATNCSPSRASMLSGKYTPEHGIFTVGESERGNKKTRKLIPIENKEEIGKDFFLIPEMLKTLGYTNGHFGKWHLGKEGNYPEQNGFDVNFGGCENGGPGKGGYTSPYNNLKIKDGPVGEYLTDRIGNEVVNFIDENQSKTFFAYVPFYSVHTPIEPKLEYEKKYREIKGNQYHNRADFAGMIQSLDENVGKILDKIQELNLIEKTLIIFTSDNGGIRSISNQFPLRAGKGSYYEGGIKVPLIFSWGEKITPNTKSYERVSNIDFFPTIKNIVGYKKRIELDGVDLSPVFNDMKLPERSLFFHFPIYLEPYDVYKDNGTDPLFRTKPGSVIIKNDWKLHHYFENNSIELYNLIEDVSESKNLSEENKEKTNELYEELNKWRKLNNAPIPYKINPDYDPIFVDSLLNLIENKKIKKRISSNLNLSKFYK
ncbi:MAG: sulfatase [Bacteroidota bacterium]|nr:sulfatase [Bacteroidota bacterium]